MDEEKLRKTTTGEGNTTDGNIATYTTHGNNLKLTLGLNNVRKQR